MTSDQASPPATAASPTPPATTRSRWAWFTSPKGAASGWILGLVFGLFGIWAWWDGHRTRDLLIVAHPDRAAIAKTGVASRLTISYDGKLLDRDVSSMSVGVWNDGREAIRQENVLKPLVLSVSPKMPILEARISRVSRDVVEPRLDLSKIAEGYVGVSWKILEHGDGVSLQLLYEGTPAAELEANGIIEGQPTVGAMSPHARANDYSSYRPRSPSERFGGAIKLSLIVGVLAGSANTYDEKRPKGRRFTPKEGLKYGSAIGLCVLLFFVGLIVFFDPSVPPFGF